MKICCISDIHGYLPEIPQADLLIIAGDICPDAWSKTFEFGKNPDVFFQLNWLQTEFALWLENLPVKKVIGIWGNHDFIGERIVRGSAVLANLPWTILTDSRTEFEGLKIYGSPWQPWFHDWAFNLFEDELKRKWEFIPDDTHILIVHGPAHGIGDLAPRMITDDNETEWPAGEHTGSPSLLKKIQELPELKLFVCGHIHEGYGQYKLDNKVIINASIMDGRTNDPTNKPIMIEL